MSAIRNNPALWDKIIAEVKAGTAYGHAHEWNARKAQYAVKLYKERGGTYTGPKRDNNRLVVWTKEDWGYVDGKPGNRYLPKEVRDSLTPAQKRAENAAKKRASKSHKQYAKYAKPETAHAVMHTAAKMKASRMDRSRSRKSKSRTRKSKK